MVHRSRSRVGFGDDVQMSGQKRKKISKSERGEGGGVTGRGADSARKSTFLHLHNTTNY